VTNAAKKARVEYKVSEHLQWYVKTLACAQNELPTICVLLDFEHRIHSQLNFIIPFAVLDSS
jgi:hypothetical protein